MAVHVRVTVPPAQLAIGLDPSRESRLTVDPQLSEAVGESNTGVASQANVASTGVEVKVGGVSSKTVIVWVHVDVLPQSSVAWYVRVRV